MLNENIGKSQDTQALIFITLCVDFVSFLKGHILGQFQNVEKVVIFWKTYDITKKCIAMFPTLA